MVASENPQVSDLVGVVGQPSGARFLEVRLQPMPMAAFDHPQTNRQPQRQSAWPMGASSTGSGCAKSARAPRPPQRHSTTSGSFCGSTRWDLGFGVRHSPAPRLAWPNGGA